MAISLTYEQQQSVDSKGNILVAAAAGSGKTAVLVERVIKKLCSKTDGISADRLLIVTFTNAAAAEMRGRIEKRLNEEILKDPDNAGLLRQKHLLGSAKICTIDSFCIDLVRENFEKAGISPDFKMSDGQTLRPTDERIVSRIVNRYLEEKNETFSALLDIIGAEYDDFNFQEVALTLYYYSRQMPFPSKWFDRLSDFYAEKAFTAKSPWWEYAFKTAEEVVRDARESLAEAIDLVTVDEKASDKYLPVFMKSSEVLAELDTSIDRNDWDTLYNALNNVIIPDLPRVNGVSGIYEVSAAKSIYKYISDKALDKLRRIFYADNEFINGQFRRLYEPLKLLSSILKEFETELFEEYKRLNTFTFHNTEQLALSLLCEEGESGLSIKEDAAEFLDRFDEVMVDEYQDTNDLQDMLFYVLSNREQKLFVVGDVKQSIYGFRGANPKNFLSKKNRYVPIDKAEENGAKKIILSKNFRCKPEVCGFINYFFESFMTESTGEIIYDSEEALVPAAVYPQTGEIPLELDLINCKGANTPAVILEARNIAEYIKKVISSGEVIRLNDNTLRQAKYSDFTVLLRSVKNKAPLMAAELKRQGIPVNYSNESFAETTEVSVILALLKIIDNPQSDIELLTAMMSPIFGFTPEDMANIRSARRDGNVYSAVIAACENGNKKACEFLKALEKYRLFAVTSPLARLISFILNDTGYLDIVSAMTDGNRRRGNLLLLCDYAEQYSANNGEGAGGFVRYILKQSQNGIKSADSAVNGETVQIMSIHASKGLQFPVCIVAGLGSDFNDSESTDSTLYSTDFGIGFKYFDEELKTRLTTVGREVILERIRCERLEEELRLLYVAMTRTQDRLLFTAAVPNSEKKINDLKTLLISANSRITSAVWRRTKSYLDWLLLSLLVHPDGKELRGDGTALLVKPTGSRIKVKLTEGVEIPDCANEEINESVEINEELTKAVEQNTAFAYPYSEILNLESKASVSALANKAESAKYAFMAEPSFMAKGGITGAGRGTATHKVMQFFDFSKYREAESEIERLREWQFITEQEAEAVNIKAIGAFFESDVFGRILKSKTVKREMRFLTELPAKRIAPYLDDKFNDEKIIVQGAVDVCFVENDGVVVLDFKTDRVDNPEALVEAYGEQLNIYAMACEKIFSMPVKQKIIYSFALSEEIDIPNVEAT